MTKYLLAAYACIGDAVPMVGDCGRLCGSACCRPGQDDRGMLLFPGEEKLLSGQPGFRINEGLLRCEGICAREFRPLACRIFPLTPFLKKGDGLSLRMDIRGAGMCPLVRGGTAALHPEFLRGVSAALALLYARPEYRPFLEEWMEAESSLRLLRKRMKRRG
ncbi:MAG: hypothetical protein ACOX17_00135 [Christensenellales bacterium]